MPAARRDTDSLVQSQVERLKVVKSYNLRDTDMNMMLESTELSVPLGKFTRMKFPGNPNETDEDVSGQGIKIVVADGKRINEKEFMVAPFFLAALALRL